MRHWFCEFLLFEGSSTNLVSTEQQNQLKNNSNQQFEKFRARLLLHFLKWKQNKAIKVTREPETLS